MSIRGEAGSCGVGWDGGLWELSALSTHCFVNLKRLKTFFSNYKKHLQTTKKERKKKKSSIWTTTASTSEPPWPCTLYSVLLGKLTRAGRSAQPRGSLILEGKRKRLRPQEGVCSVTLGTARPGTLWGITSDFMGKRTIIKIRIICSKNTNLRFITKFFFLNLVTVYSQRGKLLSTVPALPTNSSVTLYLCQMPKF